MALCANKKPQKLYIMCRGSEGGARRRRASMQTRLRIDFMLLSIASLGAAGPPPQPSFGCPPDSCLKVTLPPSQDDTHGVACSEATRRAGLLQYATDYEAAGFDALGRAHFRSRHHASLNLYFTEPAAEFSPAMHAQWVFSRQRSNELVIGDARAVAPEMMLRVGESSAMQVTPPLGTNTWRHEAFVRGGSGGGGSSSNDAAAATAGGDASCAIDVRIACALCAGIATSSHVLEPSATRVGCTSFGLQWPNPTPPFWGIGAPPPAKFKLQVGMPQQLGSDTAGKEVIELLIDATAASASTIGADGGAAKPNFATVDGLLPGTTYALRIAAALPTLRQTPGTSTSPATSSSTASSSVHAAFTSVPSIQWTAFGPPVMLTTATPRDTGGLPLRIDVPSQHNTGSSAAAGEGSEQCSQLHLLVPAASDCDGVGMAIEWLPPSRAGADHVPVFAGASSEHVDDEYEEGGWSDCTACAPLSLAPATPNGHRLVLVSGLSPLAFYRFRMRLEVKEKKAAPEADGAGRGVGVSSGGGGEGGVGVLSHSLTREGPPTQPLMVGWAEGSHSEGPLTPPQVLPISSASFLVRLPMDPAPRCRSVQGTVAGDGSAGGRIEWAVQVDGVVTQTLFPRRGAVASALKASEGAPDRDGGGGNRGGTGGTDGTSGTRPRWVLIESMRCPPPRGCAFSLRMINVLGVSALQPPEPTLATSLTLPPRMASTADRIELRLTSAAEEGGFEAALSSALSATGGVHVIESRGSLSAGHVIVELHPPSLTTLLVRGLTLRALGSRCASPGGGGLAEWLRDKTATAVCEAISRSELLQTIDLAAGVVAEGGTHDAALAKRVAEAADDKDDVVRVGATPWLQLAPELVRSEGVLLHADAVGRPGGPSPRTGVVSTPAMLLLLATCVLAALVGWRKVSQRAMVRNVHEDLARSAGASAAGSSIGLYAYCTAACELIAELLESICIERLPPDLSEAWYGRVKPALVVACGVVGRATCLAMQASRSVWDSSPIGASVSKAAGGVSEWFSGNVSSSRMGSVAPGSVALPMALAMEAEAADEAGEAEDELSDHGQRDEDEQSDSSAHDLSNVVDIVEEAC